MIILPRDGGLLAVRQPDHADVSASIASGFRRPTAIPESLWPRLIDAVRHHDDGWLVEERRPALDGSGRPLSFLDYPPFLHLEVWRRSVDLARPRDSYAAVLIALHSLSLSCRMEPKDPAVMETRARFQEEMREAADIHRRALLAGTSDERAAAGDGALEAARRLLGLFDVLSLLALGALPLPSRTEPVPFAGETEGLSIERACEILTVEPWPFVAPVVSVEARAVHLEEARFKSPARLAAALVEAPEEAVRAELRPKT